MSAAGQDRERRLAADRVQHFGLRVDALDAAHPFQVTGRRLFQDRVAVVRVTAVLRLARFRAQLLDHFREGHLVRLADAQVNDFRAGMGGHGGAFGAFDLLELVDRLRLAVLAAANPLRKKALNV